MLPMKLISAFVLFIVPLSLTLHSELISNFTVNLVKTDQSVVLGCKDSGDNKYLCLTGKSLMKWNQLVILLNLVRNFSLENALTRYNRVKTSVILDCSCSECFNVLQNSHQLKYFNKTYQWMIWDPQNHGINKLIGNFTNIGPNAQITYVNGTTNEDPKKYFLYDMHSKGRHLGAPLEAIHYADWKSRQLSINSDVLYLQGIRKRGQFGMLPLRAAIVIDQNNITSDEQIIEILSRTGKQQGLATFVRYHYDLLVILADHLNFTLKFRNLRGWAGKLRGGPFRLGYLGALMRNEVDVGASGAFNRINRFPFLDNIHMSWKFDSAFLFRYTTDIDTEGKSGDFLAPFEAEVWIVSSLVLFILITVWYIMAWLIKFIKKTESHDGYFFNTFSAICQQGLDPVPEGLTKRTIILNLFMFCLIMYNFYTSSVVGGLLNSSAQGPKTITEIINSPLKLTFEDIGYYKVLFKNSSRPAIQQMYKAKIKPKRGTNDLPVFTQIREAIPFLKKGGYALHCEKVDAYPEIARFFDANEICDLRVVSGLLESEVIAWFVSKNSVYTELFRITMCRARETGLVKRAITIHKPEKPECQASITVFPVAFSGVSTAFIALGGGMLASVIVLVVEIMRFKVKQIKGNDKNSSTLNF